MSCKTEVRLNNEIVAGTWTETLVLTFEWYSLWKLRRNLNMEIWWDLEDVFLRQKGDFQVPRQFWGGASDTCFWFDPKPH